MIEFKDAYLFIVYGKSRKEYSEEFNNQQKQALQNATNQVQQNANSSKYGVSEIAKRLGMAVYTSPIVQNFASKNIPNSLLSRLNSGIYDIMADGKISVAEVADDFIRTGTNILDGTAVDLGYPTVSALYNAIRPDGTGIFSKDANGTALTFIKSFSKNAQKQNQAIKDKKNNNLSENNEVIKFKLVTEDNEKWNTNTPERKTESGMSLIPVLGNDNIEKDFSVSIVDNDINGSMYDIKDKLLKLRNLRESFDIYIVDEDVKHNYTLNNCVFTSISTSVEGKNSLSIDISVMQIPEYSVKPENIYNIPSSIKGSGKSGSKSGNSKSGIKSKDAKNQSKTTNTSSKSFNISKEYTCDDLNFASQEWNRYLDKVKDPNTSSKDRHTYAQRMQTLTIEGTNRINKYITDPSKKFTSSDTVKVFKSKYKFTVGSKYTLK